MKIDVIIPVIRKDLLKLLIDDFKGQSLLPAHVLVIDNSGTTDSTEYTDMPFPVTRVAQSKNIGVNASWNLGIGICLNCDAVAILNDDIRISVDFFKKIAAVLNLVPDAAVVCPQTLPETDCFLQNPHQETGRIIPMRKREGWAMSIRRDILDQIPPIPDSLRTFCGDDWFWYWTVVRLKKYWVKDLSNIIYHHVGASMVENLNIRAALKAEKAEFARIIRGLEAN